jgi:hypothetical protein
METRVELRCLPSGIFQTRMETRVELRGSPS